MSPEVEDYVDQISRPREIRAVIRTCKDMDVDNDRISKYLMERFNLSETEISDYLDKRGE